MKREDVNGSHDMKPRLIDMTLHQVVLAMMEGTKKSSSQGLFKSSWTTFRAEYLILYGLKNAKVVDNSFSSHMWKYLEDADHSQIQNKEDKAQPRPIQVF